MTADERYAEAAADANTCPDDTRPPITFTEVAIIVGYTAVVVALTCAALLGFQGVLR